MDRRRMRAGPMPAWAGGRKRHRLSRRDGLYALVLLAVVGAVIYLQGAEPVLDPDSVLTGRPARVVDGDTFDLAGQRLRLYGMDAPEHDQTCTDAHGAGWRCGEAATTALRGLIAGRMLDCRVRDVDRYERLVARCRADEDDIAATMVAGGLAVASGAYFSEEREARAAARGLWQGRFVAPDDWRRDPAAGAADPHGRPSRFDRLVDALFGWWGG